MRESTCFMNAWGSCQRYVRFIQWVLQHFYLRLIMNMGIEIEVQNDFLQLQYFYVPSRLSESRDERSHKVIRYACPYTNESTKALEVSKIPWAIALKHIASWAHHWNLSYCESPHGTLPLQILPHKKPSSRKT